MELAFLISAFVTLFVIIDPIGLAPLMLALTRGMSPARRRAIGLRACLIAAGLLTVFGLAGEGVLAFIGISMPAFRIAGGVLLFLTALDMLFERRTERREDKAGEADHADDPSVFPLAMPLIAGPGAMAAMILLVGQVTGPQGSAALAGAPAWQGVLAVHLVMLAVLGICFGLFLLAPVLERALGRIGVLVVTRLLGMLLAALSVQFVLDGLRTSGVF